MRASATPVTMTGMRIAMLLMVVFFPAQAVGQIVGGDLDDWRYTPFGEAPPSPSTWYRYYTNHARARPGPEQRLPNGIAWRLHTDEVTRLAAPRITWMPDKSAMRRANALLQVIHGGALVMAAQVERKFDEENTSRGITGPEYKLTLAKGMEQTDVALTYAGSRLASMIDLGYVETGGSSGHRVIRTLTLDLMNGTIRRIDKCPGRSEPYGSDEQDLRTLEFQFLDLLRVCDQNSFGKFTALLRSHGSRLAQSAPPEDPLVRNCIHHYRGEVAHIGGDLSLQLYLAFEGLAVMNIWFWPNVSNSVCALRRSALNPVIIPYRELEPFMIPGPQRDELLALR